MDQFSAHLDRGWDLIQRGDTRGAEASARRALELDPNSPEAHNLLGYAAALAGEGDDAIEAYRQAIALDDTYLEAMLNAAEVYIHPLHDYDEAINMCDQALELAEVDEEVIEALLLKFDALLGKSDTAEATAVLGRVPSGPYENPNHTFLIGRAFYEVGAVERSAALIEEAVVKDPQNAEAQYYLGLVRDERGDTRGATLAFLRSRELDVDLGMPPWAPSSDDVQKFAESAILGLNQILRTYVEGADVFISDVPGVELVADGVDPRALVLLDGIAADESSGIPGGESACVRIFVYALNIARLAGSADAFEHEITAALEREITSTFLEPEQAERNDRELN